MIPPHHEGRRYAPFRLRVDRATGHDYWRALGLATIPEQVPPTYLIFLRGEQLGVDLFRDLDIPRRQALHGGQRYEWFAPIGWDDQLDVDAQVTRVAQRPGKAGTLWFADVVYEYRHADGGALAQRETTRLIKRSLP